MITFLGILAVLLGLVSLVGGFIVHKEPREITNRYGNTVVKQPLAFAKLMTVKNGLIAIIVGFLMIILSAGTMYARAGHQYFIVNPFGTKYAVMDSGYKLIMPFSRVQEWEKYIDIKVISKDTDGQLTESAEGVDGVISDEVLFTVEVNGKEVERKYFGVPITFIDKVRGVVSLSSRFQIPQDEPSFIKLAEEFRHPMNLVNNTLIPTVREQVINTAYMFSADDYVSGDASNFRQTLDDQLKNGGFAVDKIEQKDTIYVHPSLAVNTDIVSKKREIQEIKSYYKVEKRMDKNGKPIRIPHDIKKNMIMVSQVIVDDVELEPKFRQKLEMQRDISAQKGIELQKIETAAAATKRIAAEGERDKTAERMNKEEAAVGVLIEEETKVKKEESKRQLAIIALETAKLDSQRRKVEAEATRMELQIADGLSVAEKYKIDKMAEVEKARSAAMKDALSNLNTVIIGGGSGSNSEMSVMESIFSAEMLKSKINSKQ